MWSQIGITMEVGRGMEEWLVWYAPVKVISILLANSSIIPMPISMLLSASNNQHQQ